MWRFGEVVATKPYHAVSLVRLVTLRLDVISMVSRRLMPSLLIGSLIAAASGAVLFSQQSDQPDGRQSERSGSPDDRKPDDLPQGNFPQGNFPRGEFPGGFPGGGGGFPGPGGGFPGGGPGAQPERELVDQFDTNKDGWLNDDERKPAREFVKANPTPRRGPGGRGRGMGPGGTGPGGMGPGGAGQGGFGPPGFSPQDDRPGRPELEDAARDPNRTDNDRPRFERRGFEARGAEDGPRGGMRGNRGPAAKGELVSKDSVQPQTGDLYDPAVLRTIFVDFTSTDWEAELDEFHGSDVDVTATLTVDGQTYPNCGIHFRGMSSYDMVPAGYKRSLNVSVDLADKDQRLLGYKTLNLLNNNGDSTLMSSVLYSQIARLNHIPAPKANSVRVVINGEDWGIYSNVQQFNKEFLQEQFGTTEGARWKVSGSPAGGGGLDYRGDDVARYSYPYEQRSGGKQATKKLVEFCRVLNETPIDQLPAAIEPMVDIDNLLGFIALDCAVQNSDGYWVRASDYSIYMNDEGKFHFIPHDMNESFRPGGGRGGFGPPGPGGFGQQGPGGFGPQGGRRPNEQRRPEEGRGSEGSKPFELDPLVALNDPSKPLRSRILQVPQYRERYLAKVREIAQTMDWKHLGPFITAQANLIEPIVKSDVKMTTNYEAFLATTSEQVVAPEKLAEQTDNFRREDGPRGSGGPGFGGPGFGGPGFGGPGGHGAVNLKQFLEGRQQYLLRATL